MALRSFFGRPSSSTPARTSPLNSPFLTGRMGTTTPAATTPAARAPTRPTAPTAPKNPFVAPDTDDPFNPRREHVFNMPGGAAKTRARTALRTDVQGWNQRQAAAEAAKDEAELADVPNVWGDDGLYDPTTTPSTVGSGNFGFDPNHDYGNELGGYLESGIGRAWVTQNPEAYYTLAQARAGNPTDDSTSYGRYIRGRFDDMYANYGAAQGISPNLSWSNYMTGVMPQMEQQYRASPYQLRGDIPTVSGSATWLGGF